MFSKWGFMEFIVIFLYLQGAVGFFVKHVQTGMCINDTSIIQSQGSTWGSVSFVELSNNCLDPAAQFRFRDNGAMLNLERQGCLVALYKSGSGYRLDMFYIYVGSYDFIEDACGQRRAINQTTWGGLYLYYKEYDKTTYQTWCAVPKTYKKLAENDGIDPYIGLTTCDDAEDKRFHFGSVTCDGNMVDNANCPKDQYMVVKTASYRGLSATKTCGLSDDYSCEVDATCLVKKQCDGQHECNVTVDDNLFSGDPCPGLTKYLYFEYQCNDTSETFEGVCVLDVSLSHSTLPNEGFVQILTKYNGTKSVCWQSLQNRADDIVCRQLGYSNVASLVSMAPPLDTKDEIFSGSLNCNGGERDLSQCSITTSTQSCSELSYIKCLICPRPLLDDKQRFPDSSFTASASSKGHSASDARISSGSSWCTPVSNVKHYLQVDFGKLYMFYYVAIFGDSTSSKWVAIYNLDYTVDLINWRSVNKQAIFQGNKNAYNDAAIQYFRGGITARAVRFIPLTYAGQPCMRIEICGATLLPDKPTNLTVTKIKSKSAEISWLDPDNTGDGDLTGFLIKLKKENSLIQNITTNKLNEYELDNLTPYTIYKISVAAGNKHGFGEETITSFITSEEAPEGPPLNVKLIAERSSSLSVTWEPPEKNKRNGIIVSYTVCISHEESKPCFKEYTTKEKMLVIDNLIVSTKYYVRVLASTKVGRGNYSESKGKFTNGKQPEVSTNGTEYTLTFSLQIPSQNFKHFYVVALKLKNGQEGQSPESYENNDLVTYAEARTSTDPKPYIAEVVTSKDENIFILGDGRNTSNPTSRRRRSTSSDYYNGPLEPGTSYSIFQRIVLNDKGDYYSTDWSPVSKTSEYTGGPRVLTKMSSGDIKAKEGDLVNLLCSAQGEPPITFSWEKDQKPLESFVEKDKPHRSSFLVLTVKDQSSFGEYICHIRDRFQSITHTISVQKDTGENYLAGIIVLAILLVISFVIIAYFIYQIRRPKSSKANPENKSKDRNNSKDIYENPDKIKDDANYEQRENEQSTYTALKRPGKDENDDHLYSHLNEVHKDYVNQEETGI